MKIGFTGSPLERIDIERDDPAAYAARRADPRAVKLCLDGLDPVADGARLAWEPLGETANDLALLGEIDGVPRFVELVRHADGRPYRAFLGLLDALAHGESGTYAAARSLVDWHARHRFCAKCGTATEMFRSGWGRRCGACGAEHYPRTDPVVIMLAEHSGHVLVGRQARFPAGLYSALAGFVEVGESIEEAVARELFEEAGVRAIDVRYVASQPWPFPSQLMIGCIARVEAVELCLDEHEIEAALWVDRDTVRAALAGDPAAPFSVPPRYAIAHTLLAQWVEGA
jgi:NAD+ diphosphatase